MTDARIMEAIRAAIAEHGDEPGTQHALCVSVAQSIGTDTDRVKALYRQMVVRGFGG